FAMGESVVAGVSPRVAFLVHEGLKTMLGCKVEIVTALVVMVSLAAAGLGMAVHQKREVGDPPVQENVEAQPGSRGSEQHKPLEEKQVRVDAYGDPLPDGALARLGTVRLRQGSWILSLSLAADGKLLASSGIADVRLWDLSSGKELRSFKG